MLHNEHLSSKQSDLICERRTAGGPPSRFLVECKYRESAAVPKSDVTLFVSEYDTLRHQHHLSAAVMITNTAFTAETRALYANRSDILLTTEAALTDELLNVTASLQHFVDTYRSNPIYRQYVRLRDDQDRDLESSMDSWLRSRCPVTVLLGDFGTGKTTFVQRFRFVLSERYLAGKSSTIPCYFRLRDFARSPDLDAFVRTQLLNNFGTSDLVSFSHLLATGRLLLLLDGFDEMGKQSNETARMNFFSVLTPLFVAEGRYVVTCRPSYFVSADEMHRVFGQLDAISPRTLTLLRHPESAVAQDRRKSFAAFESAAQEWTLERSQIRALGPNDIRYARLAPFTSDDIDTYLKLRESDILSTRHKTWESVRSKIRSTYDLEDLAGRPILLNLIVETLPTIPDNVEPSPAVIYGHYTAAWLNHDYSKGEVRWLLKKEDKLLFTCSLAFHMYDNDILRLHYTELPDEIGRYLGVTDPLELTYLATDIQGSSFLRGDGLGFFEFAHKSFAEFFTAVYLRDRLVANDTAIIERQPLSEEVLFFLGDLVYIDPELRAKVTALFRKPPKGRGANMRSINLLRVLGYSRSIISQARCVIEGVPKLRLTLCTVDSCDITANVPEVTLDRSSLRETVLTVPHGLLNVTNCEAATCDLIAVGSQQALGLATFVHTSLTSCTVFVPSGSAGFEECKIRRTHLRGANPWRVSVLPDDEDAARRRSGGGTNGRKEPTVRVVATLEEPLKLAELSFSETSLEESCLENVEIRVDSLDDLRSCEMVGVMIHGLTSEAAATAAKRHLLAPNSSTAIADLERRATELLRKCIPKSAQQNRRREVAAAMVASLGRAEKQFLRWVLDVTTVQWLGRIEPIASMDSVLADCLAELVRPEASKGARKSRRRDGLT